MRTILGSRSISMFTCEIEDDELEFGNVVRIIGLVIWQNNNVPVNRRSYLWVSLHFIFHANPE